MRRLALVALALTAGACRDYDHTRYNSSQDGLLPADDFAKWGPEQATATAIGRAFAQQGADSAAAWAKRSTLVRAVDVDSLGDRMVVTFTSGWVAQVNPIDDGKAPADTEGLPK